MAERRQITVAFRLPPEAEAAFEAAFETKFLDGALPKDLATLAGAEALIVTPPIQVKAETVKALPSSVKAVGTYSVGMDHLDAAAIKASGRAALFTPDVLTDAVADTAILLMLGATRRATESINLIRSGEWQGWHSRLEAALARAAAALAGEQQRRRDVELRLRRRVVAVACWLRRRVRVPSA